MSMLRDAIDRPGPFASAYFDATHNTEDAARLIELRWQSVRAELSEQGAAEDVLDTMTEAVRSGPGEAGRPGRALVCSDSRLLVDETLPVVPAQTARYSPLPYLLPVFEFADRPVPHVAVVADRI